MSKRRVVINKRLLRFSLHSIISTFYNLNVDLLATILRPDCRIYYIQNISSMRENKENELSKTTLTDQLFKIQSEQNEIMNSFRYRFPLPEHSSQNVTNNDIFQRHIKEREKTIYSTHSKGDKTQSDTFFKIDSKASIVNGKLILFETGEVNYRQNGRELMKLLRENKIDYKEYMLGDKVKYHKQIEQRQKNKEETLIREYIDKHINMEKTTKIEVANHAGKSFKNIGK